MMCKSADTACALTSTFMSHEVRGVTLTHHQAKEAKTGSAFAEQEYEKYRQAAKEAQENYESGMKKHEIERKDVSLRVTCH